MKNHSTIVALAVAIVLIATANPVRATLFSFSWLGDPTQDATILSSTDRTLRAFGTIDIDAAAGSDFTLDDIIQTDISVTGDSIDDFIFSTWVEAGGSISADGLRASFSGAGNPFSAVTSATFFGCRHPGCEFNFAIDVSRTPPTTPIGQVVYGSPAEALASMRMRAIAVAEPGTLALFLAAMVALTAFGVLPWSRKTRGRT